jgi:hypothetical protein
MGFLIGVLTAIVLGISFSSSNASNGVIKITAYNPYSIRAQIELKCNWRIDRFMFHKFIEIPGKHNTIIYVPNNMRDCQIWPKIFIFG